MKALRPVRIILARWVLSDPDASHRPALRGSGACAQRGKHGLAHCVGSAVQLRERGHFEHELRTRVSNSADLGHRRHIPPSALDILRIETSGQRKPCVSPWTKVGDEHSISSRNAIVSLAAPARKRRQINAVSDRRSQALIAIPHSRLRHHIRLSNRDDAMSIGGYIKAIH